MTMILLPSTARERSQERIEFRKDVIEGLSRHPKRLPCKYFYDRHGSELFDRICELDEYYPTRTELTIMQSEISQMAARLGPRCLLVELGSGSSVKTRLLLKAMLQPAGYVPVDISGEHLVQSARRLAEEFPEMPVLPVHADFSEAFSVPQPPGLSRRCVVYFPGSTIGNFTPRRTVKLLGQIAAMSGDGGGLLIGIDLKKDPAILEAAYNDREGVTAKFNLNLLARIGRELEARVRLDKFEHRAFFNAEEGRIEMYLVSTIKQTVCLPDVEFKFEVGEMIHTENSYKYDLDEFAAIADEVGLRRAGQWTDAEKLFGVQYFETAK